jgi:hypothetical protein
MRHGRLALTHKSATIISNAIYSFLPISIRRKILHEDLMRTGDSEPAEVFERLAATAADVPVMLMEQKQKLWDADAKAVARVWRMC